MSSERVVAAEPVWPEALGNTRIHSTTNIKSPFGDAVAEMLMDEIDFYFSIPVVRERLVAKFTTVSKDYAGKK